MLSCDMFHLFLFVLLLLQAETKSDECKKWKKNTGNFPDANILFQVPLPDVRYTSSLNTCIQRCIAEPTCRALVLSPSNWADRECFAISTRVVEPREGWETTYRTCIDPNYVEPYSSLLGAAYPEGEEAVGEEEFPTEPFIVSDLTLKSVEGYPDGKWVKSQLGKAIDGKMSTFAQRRKSVEGSSYLMVNLDFPAEISQVSLYHKADTWNTDIFVGSRVSITSPGVSGQIGAIELCGETGDSYYSEDERYLISTVKCDTSVLGIRIRIDTAVQAFKVYEIQVLGYTSGNKFITGAPFEPTEAPPPTVTPFPVQEIVENIPPELVENNQGIKEWDIKEAAKEPIPYNVLKNVARREDAVTTPLGYLALAGYVDYTLDSAKAAKSYTDEGRDSEVRQRTKVTEEDLQAAANSFLRFNGFVESEGITDEMVEYMSQPRCGNPDLEYSIDADMCDTVDKDEIKRLGDQTGLLSNSNSVLLPEENGPVGAEQVSYYFEADVTYDKLIRKKNSKSVFFGFNYDKETSNGQDTPLEVVSMRYLKGQLCAQFLTLHDGKLTSLPASRSTILSSCYTPSRNEETTKSFKIRLDVYATNRGVPGSVFVTVKGEDVAQNVYKTLIRSSVVMFYRSDHTPSMVRLCKRSTTLSSSRAKRSSNRVKRYELSNYSWETDEDKIRFNFQNYSSILGQDETRQGILKAINLYSAETGLHFAEVKPTENAEIVFMFNKGYHADGRSFEGAGAEKAHAFYPVHSEIHFNDYETFSLKKENDNSVSMFAVAAHEIGHALGIEHSSMREALMSATFATSNKAFSFQSFHADDIGALNEMYNDVEGPGVTSTLGKWVPGSRYTPKLPLPTACHSEIDAALNLDGNYWLVSGPFVWKIADKKNKFKMQNGYPKRVTDEFEQAIGAVKAMFSVTSAGKTDVYVIHGSDNMVVRYSYEYKMLFVKERVSQATLLSVGGNKVDKPIRSAFTWDGKTILIIEPTGEDSQEVPQQYYQLTWNGLALESISMKPTDKMRNIVGKDRSRRPRIFGAAMSWTRIKDSGDTVEEVMNFDNDLVFSEKVFSEARTNDAYQEISKRFKIAGWCV